MSRLSVNRSGEMEVFVTAVEAGGFSAAARIFAMSPSAVSKLVSRLEARLGARLVNRTTRRLQLTPEGCVFFESSVRILDSLAEAEVAASAADRPSGRVRLNVSASYATHVLAPVLPDFLLRYPEIAIDIVQTDAVVDLLEDRTDIAVRAGPLKSSSLVARTLGETRMVIVGSPAYLARAGRPRIPADLDAHIRIGPGYRRATEGWPLAEAGETVVLPPGRRVQASDGEAIRTLALCGVGLARLPIFTVGRDIEAGLLSPVLEDFSGTERETFHAVFVDQGRVMPARIRVVLDFLAEHGRVD
ncbi:LysR substrate-binding domain-containing protein [Rhizobium sp. TRM95111]|uniref:LysR substrate-binding domain-containing protein n=1 Tax=Rhizobium alarense TaxID=2846851 RepID=UPI001F352B70|nr:LysR substrate-binding domain-containing protein [Rhizobium alarense]MCF3640391.1 LysR substrate-binding domain-containing protein [Rhizobium alarense]